MLCLFIPPSPTLSATDLFYVSIVLFSPEYHIVGIIPYVALSDRVISLSNVHLSFFRVFLWLDSSLKKKKKRHWIIFRFTTVYPFTYQASLGLLPSFCDFE